MPDYWPVCCRLVLFAAPMGAVGIGGNSAGPECPGCLRRIMRIPFSGALGRRMQAVPTTTISSIDELRQALEAERDSGRSIALVPTMGALHAGHVALVEEAREKADVVVVSIFVNPTQFGDRKDLEGYPRTLESDLETLEPFGVEYVFAPTATEMYPNGKTEITVNAGMAGFRFEGRSRPGHFDGVLTVVSKLFHIVQPDFACFGEKDAQQLHLVSRMVADLDLPIEIVAVATKRDGDGLALSSRNSRIDPARRENALALSRALVAASRSADLGVEPMLGAAQGVVQSDTKVKLDYLVAVDPETFQLVDESHSGPTRVLIAGVVDGVRLIDNTLVYIP